MARAYPLQHHHRRRRRHWRGRQGYGIQPPWWARQDDDGDDGDDDSEYEFEGDDVELPRMGRWVLHGDKIVLLGV